MKKLTISSMGFVLVLVGVSFFSFVPSTGYSQQPANGITNEITPMISGECPPGKFDQLAGRCTVPTKAAGADITKDIEGQ
jgi:hypothetical protein